MVDLLETRPALAPAINRPAEAVADAMIAVQWRFLQLDFSNNPTFEDKKLYYSPSDPEMEKRLDRVSKNMCEYGSLYSVVFLTQKYPELFNYLFMVKNYRPYDVRFKNLNWKMHTYFIAKSKTGEWFAGSPANHTVCERDSRLTRVISDFNLDKVMQEIRRVDGGVWPKSSFIHDVLNKDYQLPAIFTEDGNQMIRLPVIIYGNSENTRVDCAPKIQTNTYRIL